MFSSVWYTVNMEIYLLKVQMEIFRRDQNIPV